MNSRLESVISVRGLTKRYGARQILGAAPGAPGAPGMSYASGTPSAAGKPGTPGKPGKPGEPGTPGTPGKADAETPAAAGAARPLDPIGIDLDIAPGETYALLGPNGCGKSTTIEILEGIRRPDSGVVTVLGNDPLTAPRAWRSRIGIVAQTTDDLGPFTARELISHFGALYPNPRGTDEVLDLVGLSEHATKRATKLSGGQQRRLDVALGIVGRPELLFLDEPTTGFDPEARRHFWAMLERLTGEGTAILLTTHYLDEAAHLADRVGVLTDGRIAAEAPPAELGGPTARTPVVSWRDASGVRHEQRTEHPGEFVVRLCAEAEAAGLPGGEPAELEVLRPSLEDIYLELIGHGSDAAGADAAGIDETEAAS